MKLPYSWIQARCDLKLDPQELAARLTSMGIEVDAIEGYAPVCEEVVVAQVVQAQAHPNADRLKIAEVFDGTTHWSVVCGAPNCRSGIKVALARIGARLPGGFEIKKSKIRSVESHGMLCSLQELGYKHDSEGICELDPSCPLGARAMDFLNDPVLELSLTPDLGHALSLEGLARLVSAKCNLPLPKRTLEPLKSDSALTSPKVALKSPSCRQYACMLLEGLKVGPSPGWLVQELAKVGLRSVNNVVDVGNWVMWEMGRPVHFFDQQTLHGELQVRLSHQNERLLRIDGIEQTLEEGLLVIADEKQVVALAGVMGSKPHEVGPSTTRAVLEIALFEPRAVRRSAKIAGCHSESSRRFERGVSLDNAQAVFERIVQLLREMGHPLSHSAITWAGQTSFEKKKISLHPAKVKHLLGLELTASECKQLLSALGLEVHLHEARLECRVPLDRHDLAIEEDLVDEIMKLIGTEQLPRTTCSASLPGVQHDPQYVFVRSLRQALVGMGLQEVFTMDFVSQQKLAAWSLTNDKLLKVANPGSQEADALRPNLLSSMIDVAAHNRAQQINDLAIFEVGSVYSGDERFDLESQALGILLTGGAEFLGHLATTKADFFDLKGVVETLFQALGVEAKGCESLTQATSQENRALAANAWLHPYNQAKWLGGSSIVLGVMGQVHPLLAQKLGFSEPLFYAEFSIQELMRSRQTLKSYRPIATFPGSSRDWTLTLPSSFSFGQLLSLIPSVDYLVDIEFVGIWQDEKLGAYRKNVSLRLHYRSDEKTLTQQEVEMQHARVQEIVTGALEKLDLAGMQEGKK